MPDGREGLDTSRDTGAKGRRKSSRWPLPVALVLAIVYWFYLNSQVFRTDRTDLNVRVIQATESLTTNGFDIRLPQNDLIVTKISTANGRPFDPKVDQLTIRVRAPGSSLKQFQTGTVLVADIPDSVVEDCRNNGFAVLRLDKSMLKDAKGELTNYIQQMEPEQLHVHLGRSQTLAVDLAWDLVKIKLPEGGSGNWESRIFDGQIRFRPESVDLEGPDKLVRTSRDQQAIFVLDLTKKLDELENTSRSERLDVTEILQVDPELVKKGVRALQLVKATVQFAPRAESFVDLAVQVQPDWTGSPLTSTEFRIDETVTIDIRSYDPRLTSLLGDEERKQRWIAQNLRCFIRPSELDPTLDTSKEDFVAHLSPHFFLYDKSFTLGRELKIQQKSLIKISRKSP